MSFDPTSFMNKEKAQDIQSQMADAQEKLTAITVEGQAGAAEHTVKISLNGRYEATKVVIDPSLLQQPIEVVSELIASAITDAAHKAETAIQTEMMKMFQGI